MIYQITYSWRGMAPSKIGSIGLSAREAVNKFVKEDTSVEVLEVTEMRIVPREEWAPLPTSPDSE
jgi:hypothetical protein